MAETKIHPGVIIGGAAAAILGIVWLSRRAKGETPPPPISGKVSLLECCWWMPPNKLSTISVQQTIGFLPSLYVKIKNTSEASQSYSILVYFGQIEMVGFWDLITTYVMDPGAEWFDYIPMTLSQSTPVGNYPVVLKIVQGVPGQEGYTEVATLSTGVSIQVTAGEAPPPPPPPGEETVALQLASCAGVISGVGVDVGYTVFCLRNGYWLAYDQISSDPVARIDDIGYFLIGDVVYLYVTSPCTLVYNGRSWTLVGGWNEFTW